MDPCEGKAGFERWSRVVSNCPFLLHVITMLGTPTWNRIGQTRRVRILAKICCVLFLYCFALVFFFFTWNSNLYGYTLAHHTSLSSSTPANTITIWNDFGSLFSKWIEIKINFHGCLSTSNYLTKFI